MKQFYLFLLILFLPVSGVFAQNSNVVNGVVGCDFLDNSPSVRTKLCNKFGAKPTKDVGKILTFSRVEIGGKKYDQALFYFRYNDTLRHTQFVGSVLKKKFQASDKEKAVDFYHSLVKQYERKYTNLVSNSGQKEYCSHCGEFPSWTTAKEGYPIKITLEEDVAEKGERYFVVSVTYLESEIDILFDDEI